MGIMQLSVFNLLADKMRWHQTRQGVLAENVANAETPGFTAHELKPFDIEEQQSQASIQSAGDGGNPARLTLPPIPPQAPDSPSAREGGFEITPAGNGVTLEDQMMKVADNQMDYQAVTALYTRSIGILKTALGRSA